MRSVTLERAETTTTTGAPPFACFCTIVAACRMRSALPTEVPPNFMTTRFMESPAQFAGCSSTACGHEGRQDSRRIRPEHVSGKPNSETESKNRIKLVCMTSRSGLVMTDRRLLLADGLAVEVDVVEDHDAGTRFRTTVHHQVNALDLVACSDGRIHLGRVCRVEAETLPSSSRCGLGRASRASGFVDDVVDGNDSETWGCCRALSAVADVITKFGDRHSFNVADHDTSLCLVGRSAGLRE